jgi:hypothetical protein
MRTIRRMSLAALVLVLSSLIFAGPAFAQDAADVALDSPIRSLLLAPAETRIDLDVDLFNFSDQRRIVKFELIDRPADWDIDIWNAFFDFRITELVVEPTELTPGQRPRMRVRLPDPRPLPGDYTFTLILTDAENSGIEYDRATFTIGVPEGVTEDPGAVEVSADFPVLRGPANASYAFEVIIKNATKDNNSFTLSGNVIDAEAQVLQGWDVGFTPAFGEQKLISSVAVRAAIDERVNVQVSPPLFVEPGEYFIPVSVDSDNADLSSSIMLVLEITGKGELLASTSSGRVSMDATAGEPARNTLRLTNYGTADLLNVVITADAPPRWEITYPNGATIDEIASIPGASAGQQDWFIDIMPPADAIPGDYEIILRATALNAIDTVTMRVTVSQSTIWGWLGIILVIAVLGGLMGLFWRLGRR